VPAINIPARHGMFIFLGVFFLARTLHSFIFAGLFKNPGFIAEPINHKGKIRFFIDLYLPFMNRYVMNMDIQYQNIGCIPAGKMDSKKYRYD